MIDPVEAFNLILERLDKLLEVLTRIAEAIEEGVEQANEEE